MDMSKYKRSETFFKGYDHSKLFLQTWEHPDAVGTIFFTHGQAEHSDCYLRLIAGLDKIKDAAKWNFIGWDLRGHGKSDGLRGYAKDFNEYVLDYDFFYNKCLDIDFVKNKRIVLLGHSLGALIQTCALSEKKYSETNPFIAGQILSSPLFGLTVAVPQWKDVGAHFMNQILPKLTLGNELNNEMLTRDPEVIREYEKDTYRHNKISSGVFLGFKEQFLKLTETVQSIIIPTQLIMSDTDPVNSSPEALRIFDALASPQKSLKLFENAKHELLNDTCREEAYKSVSEFLQKLGGHNE
jgi:alpha-beta hydrolase superfamily lysophospholipase